MRLIIPDASVVLKWVLQKDQEEDSAAALYILDAYATERIDILMPTLWRYEVGNILGIKEPVLAKDAMNLLLSYEFNEEALTNDYCIDTIKLMGELRKVSFYDTAYHCLAIKKDATYVTADVSYVKKARNKGHVSLLSEWN